MAKRIINAEENLKGGSPKEPDKTGRKSKNFKFRLQHIDRKRMFTYLVPVALILLVSMGAMAQLGLLPHIEKQTGQKYGWFGTKLSAGATGIWNPFASSSQTATPQLSKEYIYAGDRLLAIEETGSGGSATPSPTVTPTPPPPSNRVNYALASMGSVATASSAAPTQQPDKTINGERRGYTWSSGNIWVSDGGMPQWLQIDFGQSRTIDEIDVFHVQENIDNPVEPTLEMAYTINYTDSFEVQYWNGAAWITIDSVTGNNKIWKKFNFSPITTTKIRINLTTTADTYAYLTEVEAWGSGTPISSPTPTPTPAVRSNFALASNGSTASSLSVAGADNTPAKAINGDRLGDWYSNNLFVSDVGLPQWLQVDFNQSRTIDEINVITIQDNAFNPVEPTLSMLFTSTYGNNAFDVQYWNGSAWVNIASVTGNYNVWRQFTFAPVTTTKIRINVTGAADNYAYLPEVEAWGNGTP